MLLGTAFLLGLVGSLHCAGMCGPLVMALPAGYPRTRSLLFHRAVYHLGRITMYVLLGLLFGLFGGWFSLVGWQRWISIGAGAIILLGLLASSRMNLALPAWNVVSRMKPLFGKLISRRGVGAQFSLGLLNGLLPCGLVYVACAAAIAAGGILQGAGFMALFGLGTLPMMFGLGWAGATLQSLTLRFHLQRLVPVSLLIVATLLILRGMALGIPYLSPGDPSQGPACPVCHAAP